MSRRYTGAEARELLESVPGDDWEWRGDVLLSGSIGDDGYRYLRLVLELDEDSHCNYNLSECKDLIEAAPDLAATVDELEAERDALLKEVKKLKSYIKRLRGGA